MKAPGVALAGGLALGAALLFSGGSRRTSPLEPNPSDAEDRRAPLLRTAAADLGPDKDPDVYWREAGAPELVGTDADWCGGWVLAMLHRAGLGRRLNWKPGIGFFSKLPQTKHPVPGDLVFLEQTDSDPEPEQHQSILERDEGDTVHTLDGNQDNGGTSRRTRELSDVTAFFSIEPLLREPVIA